MLRYETIPVTPFQQNCSIVWCDQTMEGAVIDPGGDLPQILEAARRLGVELKQILLTHAHIDHAGGTGTLSRELKLPIVGPWTLSQQTFIDKAGKSAEGVRTSVTFIENELSSVKNQFAVNYRKINNVSRIPSAVAAAQAYDALRLISLAIFQSNSTDGPQLQAALENLTHNTTSTVVSRYSRPFTPTDHEAIAVNMIVLGEIRKGQVTYAYKEDANSAGIMRTKAPAK